MKILTVMLLLVYSTIASTIEKTRVLEVYYVVDNEITKSAGPFNAYEFKITSLCKNNYKYTIIKSSNGDISITQDFELWNSITLPIVCKN